MRPSIRLGRLAGVPVGAHWSVLVILVLVADLLAESVLPHTVKGATSQTYWVVGILVALAFLGSLIAHEGAHAVVARRRGMNVKSITIWMLGGVTELDGQPPDPRSDLAIAISGPLTSVVCAVVSAGLAVALTVTGAPDVAAAGFVWLAATNGILAIFNLLPGAPLDGGRVLRAVVWRRTGSRSRAEQAAARSGRATGFALVGLGVLEWAATGDLVGGLWFMLIGWFLFAAATAELQQTTREEALDGLTVGDVMETTFTLLPSYQHAAVAARTAIDAGVDVCPVCDMDGHPVGVVAVDRLVQAAVKSATARVADVAVPANPGTFAAPGDRLVDALRHAGPSGLLLAVEDGRLVGIVTAIDITRAVRRNLVTASAAEGP